MLDYHKAFLPGQIIQLIFYNFEIIASVYNLVCLIIVNKHAEFPPPHVL